MKIERINESTWVVDDGFVRGFLLEGTEKAVLIDTCASSNEARALAESVTDKPVILVNTHGDGDHVAGNGEFESFYMGRADYEGCNVAARFPESRFIDIEDGDIIDAGERPLLMIAIPGHTRGSVAILDVNARVLYTGDSVQDGHVYMFGNHRDPSAFAASLDRLVSMKDKYDVLRAAHGQMELDGGYVEKVRDAWQMVLDGKVQGRKEELHGRTVVTYDTDDCGFYCE